MYFDPIAYARKARDRQQDWLDVAAAERRCAQHAEQDGRMSAIPKHIEAAHNAEMLAMYWGTDAANAEEYAQQIGP